MYFLYLMRFNEVNLKINYFDRTLHIYLFIYY